MELSLGGEVLHLLPQRAAFVPAHGSLLVADAHLGKAQSFRRLGVPVPGGTTEANLARLDELLTQTQAQRIVFLGDLLHSAHSRAAATLAAVAQWRARWPAVQGLLVRGNHDAHAGDPPPDWRLECVDEPYRIGGLALRHHPAEEAGAYALAGHVHPAVRVARGFESLRLPCFHFGARQGLLPAFGEFTGSHVVKPRPGDRVVVIAQGQLRELPTLAPP